MSGDAIVTAVEQQDWLQPVQDSGQAFVKKAFAAAGPAGQPIKNALHGVWLGHPLHSAVTDVPVGSWTVAAVLDVLDASGRQEYAPGADAAVAIGLVGAVGAAASGLADWSETQGKPQRVGAMHGLLNAGAAVLYAASYACRKSGNRAAGRLLSFTGFAAVIGSAYLGGALAYSQKVGVNHADEDGPEEFTAVCEEAELTDAPKRVDAKGIPVLLIRNGGEVLAMGERCSHAGGPLADGKIEGDTVVCPWHGSRFCLRDGHVIDGPATNPQPVFDVQTRAGQIWVRSRES